MSPLRVADTSFTILKAPTGDDVLVAASETEWYRVMATSDSNHASHRRPRVGDEVSIIENKNPGAKPLSFTAQIRAACDCSLRFSELFSNEIPVEGGQQIDGPKRIS